MRGWRPRKIWYGRTCGQVIRHFSRKDICIEADACRETHEANQRGRHVRRLLRLHGRGLVASRSAPSCDRVIAGLRLRTVCQGESDGGRVNMPGCSRVSLSCRTRLGRTNARRGKGKVHVTIRCSGWLQEKNSGLVFGREFV
jgi:hypothetical protein